MQTPPLTEIFNRYLQNKCSPDEVNAIITYFSTDTEAELRLLIRRELEKPDNADSERSLHLMSQEVLNRLKPHLKNQEEGVGGTTPPFRRKYLRLWPWFAAAACLILLLGTGITFFTQRKAAPSGTPAIFAAKHTPDTLAPAGNKAVLILSSGRRVNLDDAHAGRLATDANALIRKTAEGKLVYDTLAAGRPVAEIAYNTLLTPRGGKYDLTLSDGTKVSLNAASSIRYPSSFTGSSRQVDITGEAYFEVAHNAAKPFRVVAAGQLIEDLGTRFNVNAYSDEPAVATTLLEGRVRVSNKRHAALLTPGQQAVIPPDQSLQVIRDADLDEVMAWHRGLFTFHDADIRTVMRQLSRWYDVDVSYEGAAPQRRFSGKIYRNVSAMKVADMLRYKQIRFRIEGRKIIVMP